MKSPVTTVSAIVLTVLLVTSVFVGSVAFTGTASALVTSVSADSASDVQAYRTATTQTITVTVTITDGSVEDIVSIEIPDGNIVSADDVSVDNANVSASGLSVDSSSRVSVGLTDTTASDGADETVQVTVTVTHNLAAVAPQSSLDATVSAGGVSDTTQFDVVRYLGPSGTTGRVFLGDRDVDLTGLRNAPQSGSATLVGIAGDADGSLANVDDVQQADLTGSNGFQTGGYSFSEDESFDLSVVEARITDATLYLGEGRGGADVTGGSVPTTVDTLTLEVEFNFAEAEDVEVTVRDEDGLGITPQLTATDRISRSGDTLVLRNIADLDAGSYTIIVAGEDDLDRARLVVGVDVRSQAQTISLDESDVTSGEVLIATVRGTPGAFGLVRIDDNDLDGLSATDSAAERVFRSTGDVVTRRGTDSLGGTDERYVGAVVDLDDEGEARVAIDTAFLDTGTVDVEFVELDEPNTVSSTLRVGFDAGRDAEAELRVSERALVISAGPTTVRIGEEFVLTGTATESGEVKAYARIGNRWVPLRDGDGDLAEDNVDRRGRFELEIDAGRVISLPDSYRIAVVADPVAEGREYLGTSDTISTGVYSEFDTKDTTSVRTIEGDLTSLVSSSRIAANVGDEVVVSGTSFGQGDSIRIYVVGPRGQYLDADGAFGAESVRVRDNEFEEEYDTFQQRGTYTFFVVGQGRDGRYASDIGFGGPALRRDLTPQQAVEIIRDEYAGAGVDDRVIERTVTAENPTLSIEEFTDNGQVLQEEVTITGSSNRQDGTLVFVEVTDSNGQTVFSGEGEVDGATNEWEVTVDLSDVEPGTYTVRASDDEVSASTAFELVELVEELRTPSETPRETPTATVQPTEPPTETETATVVTTSATEFPGFGVPVALGALFVALLLAHRRQ